MRRHTASSSQPQEPEVKSVKFARVDEGHQSHDAGSPDEVDEWQTYHAQNVKEASARLLGWMKPFSLFMCPMLACAQVWMNGFALRYLSLSVGPAVIYMCSLQFTDMFVNGNLKAQTIWAGCFVQVCFFTSMLVLAIWLGVNAPTELLQHRTFLALALPVTASGPCWCHLPLRLYILTIIPIWVSAWLLFHGSLGFYSLTCVLYAVFSSITSVYMMHLANNDRWRAYQAICAQERERQNLVAVHAALRGMLSTLFDASCICRMDGLLIECTPELQQLFAGAEAMVGSNLCAFASTEAERSRLQDFLDTATNSVHRAATIQCSLATRHGPSEAVLYAIVLPGGGGGWSKSTPSGEKVPASESNAFFVGLQLPSAASQDALPSEDHQICTRAAAEPSGADPEMRRPDSCKVLAWDLASSCPASEAPASEMAAPSENGSDDLKFSESETSISFVSSSRPPSAPNTPATRRRVRRRSWGVQVAPVLVDNSVQTVAPTSLRPPLPGRPSRMQNAAHRRPTEATNQSGSSSGERSPGSPRGNQSRAHEPSLSSGNVSQCSLLSSSIQSSQSSIQSSLGSVESSMPSLISNPTGEHEEILIGGVDSTDSPWTFAPAGKWRRTGNVRGVSLQDFCALPRDEKGGRLSFGSLGHKLAGEKCKVCVHVRKVHGSCRFGALCFYCHAKHDLVRAPRRVFKRETAH